MRISTRIRMLLGSKRLHRERGFVGSPAGPFSRRRAAPADDQAPSRPPGMRAITVRRFLVLCCLCAALLSGLACSGAEENTAEEAPAVQEVPATTPATEPATVAPVSATAEEVATGFLEAYGAFDVEQAISYLSDDADISQLIASVGAEGVEGTLEEFRLLISLLEAEGYKQMLHSCEELVSSASEPSLRCTFDFHAIRSDEIGLGPFSGSFFDLTVRDGEIVQASKTWAIGEFSPQMWEPFAEWVSTGYPEDAAVMYTTGGFTGARLTEESIRLWGQHSREYVEEVSATAEEVATGFLEAYGAFDVEQAISYLSDDADLSGLDSPGGTREFRLLISFLEAQGYKQMLDSCEETGSSASGTEVRCTFDFHGIRSDEIGLGPYSGSYFDLTVRDGEIVQASKTWAIGEFSPQMWEPFAEWVSTTYPEDGAVMYNSNYTNFRLSEESIRLWERHSREYVEEVGRRTEGAETSP